MQTKERQIGSAAEPGFVWVYQYLYWDEAEQAHKTSRRFATMDAIRCGLGTPITTSGKKIPIGNLVDGDFAE